MEHAAPAYYVSRDGVTKEYVRGGRATARRLRRHPTAAELRSLGETPACTATLLGEERPVVVAREYAETEPTLLMDLDRAGCGGFRGLSGLVQGVSGLEWRVQ